MSKPEIATVLAFERNLDISDGIFFQTNSAQSTIKEKAVRITEKSIRGTISNRLKNPITEDPAKLDAKKESANLQKVDVATLDYDRDTLIIKWTCKVLPFTGKPCVCNNQDYQAKLVKTVQDYLKKQGLSELSRRYATNIINGRWLWRNRLGAETIKITINGKDKKQILSIDNAKDYALNDLSKSDANITKLAAIIEQGLKGEEFTIFEIIAEAKIGYGQEAYPSQELILDTAKEKSKVLYETNGHAGMHSQKIGNAIRTIDTWYPDAEFPISIEPYGSVTTLGVAFRQPKEDQDFYSIFDKWVLEGEAPAPEQQHYIIGVLIRGGVFGASSKEK